MEHENKPLTEFQEWPKIPRHGSARMIITEKIDGTNGCVVIAPVETHDDGSIDPHEFGLGTFTTHDGRLVRILAQSRNRFLPVGKGDNYAFALWVRDNAQELIKLGPGRHYGEWYGVGIGRNYGLFERRFSLFDVRKAGVAACCETVPVLFEGAFSDETIRQVHADLMQRGSQAVPGWASPEGVVVQTLYLTQRMKITDAVQGAKQR